MVSNRKVIGVHVRVGSQSYYCPQHTIAHHSACWSEKACEFIIIRTKAILKADIFVPQLKIDKQSFDHDGFILIPQLFSPDELVPLADYLKGNAVQDNTFNVPDSDGGLAKLMVWSQCGSDYIGVLPQLERMYMIAEELLGETVYHWHSKVTFKPKNHKGSWDWHQDFGHWYREGCLSPDMLTLAVAIDPMHTTNGPLQLVPGSHRLGRIEHVQVGDSVCADPEYTEHVIERKRVYTCELDIGDAVVFHANTLHASSSNQSDDPRSLLLCSYNPTSNVPWKPVIEAHATNERKVLPDESIVAGNWQGVVNSTRLLNPAGGRVYGYEVSDG